MRRILTKFLNMNLQFDHIGIGDRGEYSYWFNLPGENKLSKSVEIIIKKDGICYIVSLYKSNGINPFLCKLSRRRAKPFIQYLKLMYG